MLRIAWYRTRLAGLALLSALLASPLACGDEIEQHLRNQFSGKVLMQRGFYSGKHLLYDAAGNLTSGGRAGDWTTDGFVWINDIYISGQNLKIKARRLMVVSEGQKGLRFEGESSKKRKKPRTSAALEIDVTIGPGALTDDAADALMSKIFLSAQDSVAEVVPGYWRPCIDEGFSGRNENCRFSSEMLAVPGTTTPSPTTPAEVPNAAQAGSNPTTTPAALSRVGHGVKPPRPTYYPDPSFSDLARKAKYQGIVTLGLIVDKDGLPQKIHILNPLGAGLDAKAVEAVSKWKFQPAEKDGQAVAVQIAIEVEFHLY